MYRDENVGVARDGSRCEWLSTLERYAFPVLGQLPVSAIDAMLVHRVLEPIWSTKPHVGSDCASALRPSWTTRKP